ncbi:CRTAC1 family protein [Wenzhouxiangella marina]|uniref:ASPIC/UnbV domain protein n=1 Tax=Wenzhouxiangella marina TaxID=1579979 RepID=A0A0K0Y093_9GAMM|nr:CRTAC1 family protein [Wenzhouxiangella marina]AKS43307.1 ASPIC/UnbV domain protein [Wenzhouxiangella marina]MBB6087002.1 hypothetical protein [Wenzhouxiangella marina]
MRASLCSLALVLSAAAIAGPIRFEDITASSGVDFVHDNGRQGDWQYPEILGGGCGLVDLDGDGWLDLVLVQSGPLPRKRQDRDPPDRTARGGSRIYFSLGLTDPEDPTSLRFEDRSEAAGFRAFGYGMGVATGDVTGNGFPDLYLTHYGPNQLWRNNGDGSFTDITADSGTADPGFGASATISDLNGDGRLDLFVTNYVEHDPERNPSCLAANTRRDYCGPAVFPPQSDRLFINRGDGRFEDRTDQGLIDNVALHGLGVVALDMDEDGAVDVFVANDGTANQFWKNLGDDRFRENALMSGTAVNRNGQMEAGMGIAVGDPDRDGRFDLLLTHLDGESNTFYRNLGHGLFTDQTAAWGLLAPSLPFTGFGTGFADFDLDGFEDLFVANGAVRVEEEQREAGLDYPLRQTDLLFRNLDGRRFSNVTASAGPALAEAAVGRGAALGDLNNDGLTDLLLCDNHGPARLLINRSRTEHAWIGLRLTLGEPARDATGAYVELLNDEGPVQWRRVATDGSYLSASDPRVIFGMGTQDAPTASVRVSWPDGTSERFSNLEIGRYHTLRKGQVPAP